MANEKQLKIIKQGVEEWNRWRESTSVDDSLDLSNVDLSSAMLRGANFCDVDLTEATPSQANLIKADFSHAILRKARLNEADLRWARLHNSDLRDAFLRGTDFYGADLYGADLRKASLRGAKFVETNLGCANLDGSSVYGISVWNVNLEGAKQSNLLISNIDEPGITVDNLEVAQFIYLLLHNEKIRHIIDTITSKVVLVLGRFTPERKKILDAMRDELRKRNYLPVLFDFEKPSSRDITETVSTLAHMARFIIADITDAKSIPQELERIVPDLPSVPVQPLIASSGYEYGMFEHFRRYPWVLDTYQYDSLDELLDTLKEKVIDPAEMKAQELIERYERRPPPELAAKV